MRVCSYRFKRSAMVAIRDTSGYKLRELPAGSIFWPASSSPDANRMIDGTCGDASVLVFLRDLEERAEPVALTVVEEPIAILGSRLTASTV